MDGRLSSAVTTKKQFAVKYRLDLAEESAAHYALFSADEGEKRAPLSESKEPFRGTDFLMKGTRNVIRLKRPQRT
jgi:hypothetical protein